MNITLINRFTGITAKDSIYTNLHFLVNYCGLQRDNCYDLCPPYWKVSKMSVFINLFHILCLYRYFRISQHISLTISVILLNAFLRIKLPSLCVSLTVWKFFWDQFSLGDVWTSTISQCPLCAINLTFTKRVLNVCQVLLVHFVPKATKKRH